MQQDNPDGGRPTQVSGMTVQQAIDEMRKSLTVVLAAAQLLQRQSRQGTSLSVELVEGRADMIARTATAMIDDLKQLEDVCDG